MTDPMKDEGGSPECTDPPDYEPDPWERRVTVRFACGHEVEIAVHWEDDLPTSSTEPCWLCAPCQHCNQPVRECPCFTDPFTEEKP